MTSLRIAVVLYDGMTALDAVGPMEVLRFLPGADLVFVAASEEPVITDSGLALVPTATFEQVRDADVVVVPGGPGTEQAFEGPLVPWIKEIHATTRWTTSVCAGSLLLAAAGLLVDARATTHFSVRDFLPVFGAIPDERRVVVDHARHIVSAAGVSAGIDMALMLAELLTDADTSDAIRLVIEYDPQPARRGGNVTDSSDQVVGLAMRLGKPHGAIHANWSPE